MKRTNVVKVSGPPNPTRKAILDLHIPVEIKGEINRDDTRAFVESFIDQCIIQRSTTGTIRHLASKDLYNAVIVDRGVGYAVSSFDKKD